MSNEDKLTILKNRLSIIKTKSKKGKTGVIRKLERQIRNLEKMGI